MDSKRDDQSQANPRRMRRDEQAAPEEQYWEEAGEEEFSDEILLIDKEHRPSRHRRRRHRQRRVWPWLLLGCAGGILLIILAAAITVFIAIRNSLGPTGLPGLGGGTLYTQVKKEPITLNSLSQILLHTPSGNITVVVDPNTTNPVLTLTKKVQANSADDANAEFSHMNYSTQMSATDQVLSVVATLPDGGSVHGNTSDSIDISVTLTTSMVVNTTASPFTLQVDTSVGNITIDGISGIITAMSRASGNVTYRNGTLGEGSHLDAQSGNVTFNGDMDPSCTLDLCYKIYTEVGTLDVTMPETTNIFLRADTNSGKINSEFNLLVKSDGTSSSIDKSPLCTSCTSAPVALLVLEVGTGDINLHKKV